MKGVSHCDADLDSAFSKKGGGEKRERKDLQYMSFPICDVLTGMLNRNPPRRPSCVPTTYH